MRSERLALGGALLVGLAATLVAPKLLNKTRLAARRATGITYRSGVPNRGKRAGADPARGYPAALASAS
jgi:hypothetical protein